MLTRTQMKAYLGHAVRAARDVGPLLLRWAGRPTQVTTKRSPIDLVTEVDRRAERRICQRLRRVNRAYGFHGEEFQPINPSADYQWYVDPIDGTTNFIHGIPIFCVSIALVYRGTSIIGVIYDPSRDELFTATRSGGAFLQRRRLRVSRVHRLRDALFATGFPSEFRQHPQRFLRPFQALQCKTHAVRRMGSAALNLAYVACGRLEGVWEDRVWPWDVAAALLLIREAGGRVTTCRGTPFRLADQQIVATNGPIHAAALRVLRQAR